MNVLVTGGTGFLGLALCRALRARGDTVASIARTRSPELDTLGVEQFEGDVADLDAVLRASRGRDAIVHTAAKAGAWGRLEDYYSANVRGTDNVLAACEMIGVTRLVHTSTPSVVHAGGDLEGVDETTPYATHFLAHYPATKKIAEQRVLAASSPTLATVALRPHLIWGPGDNHLLPRLAERARSGRLRFIGEPGKRIDVTYIDNAVQAHLDALDRLSPGAACSGRAYFISDGEPVSTEGIVNSLLRAVGVAPESRRLPRRFAYAVGLVLERVYALLGIEAEPPLTRFVVEQLSTSHWFDLAAARRDLGYVPRVTTNEGLARLGEQHMRARIGK
ncbi:MAG TPA: NAD-dependent epimerase/dehydratase family protein [Candidatus Saccharimonadia bacterium]|nr:NAD-dependent epimerase/dehydratase family protein [Candidatus Saccharimonadia bacterium]